MSQLLQACLLSAGALFALVLLVRAHGATDGDRAALFCAQLGFGLLAATGLLAASDLASLAPTAGARDWLQQASQMLGVPLIATAALSLARGWQWSRPTWGRVLLGLCVFFELARQLRWNEPYALGLFLASALLLVYAGLLSLAAPRRVAAALIAGALLLASTPLVKNPLIEWQLLILAAACPLLAWLLRELTSGISSKKAVYPD
ncbi:hypothetical protein [Stutzerimonas azotifigens]|uniref:Uncharacterized protein n=1 Tax=Stutzerimonas azotifigens TaxID=291995 RepID=A0ABR5YZZ4_9GAMM|nr:hypothetical protein [Stutzerimonas azotifigens]MBA1273482.1 hypothetical protein [Stutzerimonas azotifigens]